MSHSPDYREEEDEDLQLAIALSLATNTPEVPRTSISIDDFFPSRKQFPHEPMRVLTGF